VRCPSCRSEDVFQFESTVMGVGDSLPMHCRHCNSISIGGIHVPLPEILAKPIKDLAEQQAAAVSRAHADLETIARDGNPVEDRIDSYMANHYRAAYLDGFFRALVFFRHNAKEGRLYRIRKIWQNNINQEYRKEPDAEMSRKGEVCIRCDLPEYDELCKLLGGDPGGIMQDGGDDATSSSNEHSTR
jgi:hypothetical protein